MRKSNKFSPEARERPVRMVQEQRGGYPSLWATIKSIAPKIGCVSQTLNEWVKRGSLTASLERLQARLSAPALQRDGRFEVPQLVLARAARRVRDSPSLIPTASYGTAATTSGKF